MTKNYTFHNVTTARYKINKHLKKPKKDKSVIIKKKQSRFLKHVLIQLDKLETHLNRWFDGGDLVDQCYKKKNDPSSTTPPLTTDALFEELYSNRQLMETYTKDELQKLNNDVASELQRKLASNEYVQLLKDLGEDFQGLIDNFASTKWMHLDKTDSDFYIYDYARILGAAIRPYCQSIDPLFGKSNGYCWGLTANWAKFVSDQLVNKNLLNLNVNTEVTNLQYINNKFIIFQNEKFEGLSSFEKLRLIFEVVNDLSDDWAYYLSFGHHSIGIRKIPNSPLVEIYDSNYGLFVFPDRFRASEWLHCLFKLSFYAKDFNYLKIAKATNQANNSEPSIPFNVLSADTLTFTESYIRQNLKPTNISDVWMQKALLRAHQNKLACGNKATEILQEELSKKLKALNRSIILILGLNHAPQGASELVATKESPLTDVISNFQENIVKTYLFNTTVWDGLVEELRDAPDYISLNTIIEKWLSEKNVKGIYNNDVLLTNPTYNTVLLDDFIKSNESAYYSLEFNRIEALLELTKQIYLISQYCSTEKKNLSPFIHKLYEMIQHGRNQGLSIKELLTQIVVYCEAVQVKPSDKFFLECLNNAFDLNVAKIFETLNVNNPSDLQSFTEKLKTLGSGYKQFHDHELQLANADFAARTKPTNLTIFNSFAELDQEMNAMYLKSQLSLKDLNQLYQQFPLSFVSEKAKQSNGTFLENIKAMTNQYFSNLNNDPRFFSTIFTQLTALIHSATSLSALAAEIHDKKIKSQYTPNSPKRSLCELIMYLSRYEEQSPRGYCLIDAFVERFSQPTSTFHLKP